MAHEAGLAAKTRLENSRRALVLSMQRGRHRDAAAAGDDTDPSADAEGRFDARPDGAAARPYASAADAAAAAGTASEGVKGLWRTVRRTTRAWWRSHPAHLVLEVGEPLLGRYAERHPLKLLAISAAFGGALVLAKPWRLISVTGLVVAALRSTQVSGLVASFLASDKPDRPEQLDPPRVFPHANSSSHHRSKELSS